ncbi:hypothetical protein CRENBAI_013696 [Crenichthys baileyi]|uniref:Uncharacterized protein n=1 Tax=Crenichthys baileyi TaxID=28760 RepID=A0AAV9R791_9TELE
MLELQKAIAFFQVGEYLARTTLKKLYKSAVVVRSYATPPPVLSYKRISVSPQPRRSCSQPDTGQLSALAD